MLHEQVRCSTDRLGLADDDSVVFFLLAVLQPTQIYDRVKESNFQYLMWSLIQAPFLVVLGYLPAYSVLRL